MRARHRDDWVRDLSGRHELESAVEVALRRFDGFRSVDAGTASKDRLDYTVVDRVGVKLVIELKARLQTPAASWLGLVPDARPGDVVIVDELTVRKLCRHVPHAYLLVRDVPGDRWVVLSVGDLVLPGGQARIARPLHHDAGRTKGKWVLDIADAPIIEPDLVDALDQLVLLSRTVSVCWADIGLWPTTYRRSHPRSAA